MTASLVDVRYTSPICTPQEVGIIASMPAGTVRSWMQPNKGSAAIVHSITSERSGWPTIPLVGVVETWSMRALRNAGIPMQKLRRAADILRDRQGPFVLARPVLFTDGIDLYLREHGDLYRLQDGQQPIEDVIQDYLSRVVLDEQADPTAFRIPLDSDIELVMDPLFNAGRPSLERTRTPAFAVLGALEAGERPDLIAQDYGITSEEVAAIERHRERISKIA